MQHEGCWGPAQLPALALSHTESLQEMFVIVTSFPAGVKLWASKNHKTPRQGLRGRVRLAHEDIRLSGHL